MQAPPLHIPVPLGSLLLLLMAIPLVVPAQSPSPGSSPFSGSYPLLDGDVIRYQTTPPDDTVARLQRRIDRGEAKLTFEERHGYLVSVLQQLNIPVSSQTLVFSKTSTQQRLISPATPRALYFNDNVYVGWVQGGDFVEVAAVDPAQGTMFYTLEQRPTDQPKFVRRQECLQCHASPKTFGVPGLLLRSVFTAPDGYPQLQVRTFVTTDDSPLNERWGGWYVTGTQGSQRHMGNVWIKDKEHPEQLDLESGANVTSLRGRFDVTPYLSPHSDLVALMILAHQTHLHDLITRVNWESRLALHEESSRNRTPNVPDTWSDSTRLRIYGAVDVLLRQILFADEARLRDLDLHRRLFRYPCSFLIYSPAFDALPKPALDYFYRRLWEVLTGKDENAAFTTLTHSDRQAILSILRQTKPDLPSYWHALTP